MKNIERSNPSVDEYDQPLFSKNSSAFALEIAIAKKMGYKLNFDSGAPTLEPPTVLKPVPFTTGQLGYGVLPTKTWQLEAFKECILRQLHHNNNFAFHVESVCTDTDNKAKQDLINTLQFM